MVYFYRSPQAIVISAICTIAVAAFIYFVEDDRLLLRAASPRYLKIVAR